MGSEAYIELAKEFINRLRYLVTNSNKNKNRFGYIIRAENRQCLIKKALKKMMIILNISDIKPNVNQPRKFLMKNPLKS